MGACRMDISPRHMRDQRPCIRSKRRGQGRDEWGSRQSACTHLRTRWQDRARRSRPQRLRRMFDRAAWGKLGRVTARRLFPRASFRSSDDYLVRALIPRSDVFLDCICRVVNLPDAPLGRELMPGHGCVARLRGSFGFRISAHSGSFCRDSDRSNRRLCPPSS
jgi:hypothetical protein